MTCGRGIIPGKRRKVLALSANGGNSIFFDGKIYKELYYFIRKCQKLAAGFVNGGGLTGRGKYNKIGKSISRREMHEMAQSMKLNANSNSNTMSCNAAANCAASSCSYASNANMTGVVLDVAILAASIFVCWRVGLHGLILCGLLLMILLRIILPKANARVVRCMPGAASAAA